MKYKNLGEKLRDWRLHSLLTQKNVSDELGYESSQFISNWERGISYPPVKDLFVLASLYNIPAESIFKTLLSEVVEDTRRSLQKEFRKGAEKCS
jgi:transcriptional regulator with XRE-family HTH domain